MRAELVEIYSDKSNHAVLRHPDRKFPGVLVQGDSLYDLCRRVDQIRDGTKESLSAESYAEVNELRNILWDYLTHYKMVLTEQNIPLPFSERP
jgi:hypothetical protein